MNRIALRTKYRGPDLPVINNYAIKDVNVLDKFPSHQEQFPVIPVDWHWLRKRKENWRTWEVKAAGSGLIGDLMTKTPT